MRLEPVSKDFNAKAAQTYVDFAKRYPEEAEYVIRMFAAAELERIMDEHEEEIVKAVFDENYEVLKKSLARGIANGTMSSEAIDATVEAVEFAKAWKYDPNWYRPDEHRRDPHTGRYTVMGRHTVKTSGTSMRYKHDRMLPNPPGMNDRDAAQYQEAYRQIAEVMGTLAGVPVVGLQVTHANGKTEERFSPDDQMDDVIRPEDFAGKKNGIVSFSPILADSNGTNQATGEFNIDGHALNINENLPKGYKIGDKGEERYRSGTNRNLERLSQAGAFLDDSGAATALDAVGLNYGVPGVGSAVATGARFMGDYGQVADKVVEPGIRRAFYRYQGSEKKPDSAMLQAMSADTRGATNPQDARDRLFIPRMETTVTPKGYEDVPVPSKFLRYWQSRLPDAELLNLHTSSGAIPPSEGMILNSKGKPVVQAVGMHDDHYLPFNLKRMNRAKGGEYIRTRSVGGLTSEDIDGGIIGGTNAVTVVSHSGIFTMEFNRAGNTPLKKARRVRMRRRYEQLVDSLASKQVKLGTIPPDREAELRAQVEAQIPGDTAGIQLQRKNRLEELKRIESDSPQPSQKQKDEWTEEFLFNEGEKWTDREGQGLGVDQLRAEAQGKAKRALTSDQEVIEELGVTKQYEDFMRAKANDYSSQLGPLRTNGEGYFKAMKALKEQFPYDIKDVRWTPPDAQSVGGRRGDVGYVKPKHLRSDNIKTGFWDPEVDGYINPGNKRERDLKGTGKRRASMDNFSGAKAREKLGDDYYRPKESEDSPKVSGGGGYSSAPGVSIKNSTLGPTYSGFGRMEGAKDVQLTPYQQVNQMMKVRRAVRTMGSIQYIKEDGTKGQFNPWDSESDSNQVANDKYRSLFAPMNDEEFQSKLANDDQFRKEVQADVQRLYTAGQGSDRGIGRPLARLLTEKKLFNGLVKDASGKPVGTPQTPNSALGLVSSLESGEKTNYDFTQGYHDGSLYLPGLTRREYRAAWNADPDISAFTATSERRFGAELSMDVDNRKVARLCKEFGRAMREGLDQAQDWKAQIQDAGGSPGKVKNQTVVKYGGKNYSVFAAKELEDDIARDALAVAKIKQLREVIGNAKETDVDAQAFREISLEEAKERHVEGIKDPDDVPDLKFAKPVDQKKLEQAKANLDNMVGLGEVQEEFDSLVNDAEISRRRVKAGLPVTDKTMHLVFTGNPGTGKTTVAQEIARAYNALGLIPKDKVVTATRADLVGQYAGHTAAKTRKKFNEAKGGVLFIDEAYSLVNGDDDSFGFEAVDELVAQSENNRDNTVVILAGYPNDMGRLMSANPGLKSRFPRTINFPDYSAGDLSEINARGVKADGYTYAPGADKAMEEVAVQITHSPHYSNARDERNFRDLMLRVQGKRVNSEYGDKATREELSLITPDDVNRAKKLYFKQRTGSRKLVAV